jgi:serine/threonine protein kinase
MVGTPQYCSPEQCLGQQIDGRSDIYSLGCILYEMFCGEPPFESDNAIGVVYMHIHEKPVQPSKKTADKLSPGVEAIICKCLEKKASDRYQSMQELLADLTLVANGDGDKIAIAKEAQTEKKPKVIILTTLGLIAFCLLYFTLAKFASVHSDSRTKTASIKSTKINSTADSKQLIESQLQANAFRQEKQIEKAAELERKIKQQCYYLCKEPRAALPILTDVSASLDKQGDFNGSKKFALMVFDCLSRLDKQNQIFDGMYKYAEAVCQGLLNSKRHLTSDQARIVEQVSFIPMFPDAGSSESQYTANLVVLEHNYHRFPLTKEYANALSKKITSDITSGKADDAEISECINANLQVNGKYSLASANMFIDMGRTYNLAGHKANARKYGRLAKECLEQNQDSHDNLDVGVSWARLGQMYSSLSDANDCIYCCRKAVEITEFECKGLSAVKLRQPAGTDSLSNTLDVFAAAEKEFLFRTETLVQNLIHFNRFAECENVAKELYTQSLKSEGIPERLRIDSARHLIDVLTELKKFDKARQIIAEVGAFYKAHLLKKRAESFHEQTTTDGSMRELIKDLIRLHMEKEAIETLPTLAQVQSRQSKERIVLLEIYTYIALSDAAKLKDSFNNALAVGPSASILSARTQTWIELIEYAKNNFNSEENKKLKNFLSECIKTMVSKTDIDSLAIAKICASIRYVLKDEALYQELNAFIEQSLPKYKLELYRQDYAVAAGEK